MEKTELVVNLIRKENLMVLVIRNRPPEVVKRKKEGLMNILQEQGEANGGWRPFYLFYKFTKLFVPRPSTCSSSGPPTPASVPPAC